MARRLPRRRTLDRPGRLRARLILDLHLPDIDGAEVLRRLRADERTIATPVVILSADATRHREAELRALGAMRYRTKPISVLELLVLLDEVLGEPTEPDAAAAP